MLTLDGGGSWAVPQVMPLAKIYGDGAMGTRSATSTSWRLTPAAASRSAIGRELNRMPFECRWSENRHVSRLIHSENKGASRLS